MQYPYFHEGLCRVFGCTLRRHKCNCPWSRTLVSPVYTVQPPPFLLRRSERKGEEPKAKGDGEVCRRGGCKVNEANDNRICCPSIRALGGYCLQYPYCPEGFVMYVRVHFAKAQVQLRLEQQSSLPRIYRFTGVVGFGIGRCFRISYRRFRPQNRRVCVRGSPDLPEGPDILARHVVRRTRHSSLRYAF